MSRPINESVELLTETLGNCKSALSEKQVAEVDNIKISDVDEKIAEIQAGGSGGGFITLVHEHYERVSESFTAPTCKLRSLDKRLNYDPTDVRTEEMDSDGDDHDAYGYYTFKIPRDDITEHTMFEFYNADSSDAVEQVSEIDETGFSIIYDPVYKLLKTENNEWVGYLSKKGIKGPSFKKLNGYITIGIFGISFNSKGQSISRLNDVEGFTLSTAYYSCFLVTFTDPYIVIK